MTFCSRKSGVLRSANKNTRQTYFIEVYTKEISKTFVYHATSCSKCVVYAYID